MAVRTTKTTGAADASSVRSVRRALAILRAFGPSDRGLALGDIARRADLDKATARRLLRTLMAEGVMHQDAAGKAYGLALGALTLAAGPTPADPLRRRAQPILAALARATGATAFVAVPYEGEALCIEVAMGEPVPACPVAVGGRVKLHACAGPRVLMAFLPLEARMALLAGPLPALTAATPTDPFLLSSTLDTIRQRGWEAGSGEVVPGIASVAVPVRASRGDVVAVLGLAGPDAEILAGGQPRHLDLLLSKAEDLGRRIG